MDAIVKALEARGHAVSEGPSVRIKEEDVAFGIKETVAAVCEQPEDHDLTGYYEFGHSRFRTRYAPTDKLGLVIPDAVWTSGCRAHRRCGTRQRLEDCLTKFIDGLLAIAARKCEHTPPEPQRRGAEEEAARKREEAARQRAELRRQQAAEQGILGELLRQVQSWRMAQDIRQLVETVCSIHTKIVHPLAKHGAR